MSTHNIRFNGEKKKKKISVYSVIGKYYNKDLVDPPLSAVM